MPSDQSKLRRILDVLIAPFRRTLQSAKYAAQEEHFVAVAGAGAFLVLLGTVSIRLAKVGAWSTGSTSPSPR